MITTNDPALKRRLDRLRSHGITREAAEMQSAPHGAWYYEQIELGFNYRMTDLQAALGCSQLQRIDAFVERRRQAAGWYDSLLGDLPLTLPGADPDAHSALHLYPIRLDPGRGAAPRDRVFRKMREGGIGVNVHYIPIPTQPYYRSMGIAPETYSRAQAYYENAISLPLFADLTRSQAEKVVELLKTHLI